MTTIQPPSPVQPPPVPAYQPPAPAYQPPPVCDPIPAPVYQPSAPPVSMVRVIPGYPDPNCGKLYTLQIGSYSTASAAGKAEVNMRNNGFNVSQELSSPYYRIIISGVQASTVYGMVQRLGTMGVAEVIIR
jgi:cell division protein FtsN